jgi:hypothetical protein
MAYYTLEDLSNDPKLAEALGNMVAAWAGAEVTLISTLARITGMPLNMAQAGYYRIPTFEARVKFIRALMTEWKTDLFNTEGIDLAIQKLSKLASTRNHWIHGDWCASDDEKEIVVFDHRADPDSSHRRKPVKAADVTNHCKAVLGRARDLAALVRSEDLEA